MGEDIHKSYHAGGSLDLCRDELGKEEISKVLSTGEKGHHRP